MVKRTPQVPEYFGTIYTQCVDKAYEKGTFAIECSSDAEAQELKFSMYRYFRSMSFHRPEDPHTARCMGLKVKIKGSVVELSKRAESSMVKSMESALERGGTTIDPERDRMRSLDDEFRELRRLEAEGKLPGSSED